MLDYNARRPEGPLRDDGFARLGSGNAIHRLRDCMPAHAFGRNYEVTLVKAIHVVGITLACVVLSAAVLRITLCYLVRIPRVRFFVALPANGSWPTLFLFSFAESCSPF